ncbi:MAG: threonine/serine exporter family protein, partial [Aureibaculum sp.]
MNTIIFELIELSIWSGIAAVGFSILFNVPRKSIITIFILGFGAGLIKFLMLHFNVNIVFSSFLGAFFVGLISIPLAHKIHLPPVVFTIPTIIPMIPGFYAYETVLYVMKYTLVEKDISKKYELINGIFSNGFNMVFILIAITLGITIPMLLLRKSTVKRVNN